MGHPSSVPRPGLPDISPINYDCIGKPGFRLDFDVVGAI